MQTEVFGQTTTGESVEIHTLTNRRGLKARLSTWGAGLVEMHVPDRHGVLADVTLGYDTLDGYLTRHPYFGVTTGRYANRIAGGKFTLDGTTYTLATNVGPHHLHGGVQGLDRYNWHATPGPNGSSVRFTLTSADGDEGYPGNLRVAVLYTLNDEDELRLDYEATTDRPTVLNLTNHAYWNLAGPGGGDILRHEVQLHARRFVAVGDWSIPTGELTPAAGAMDFTKPKRVAQDWEQMAGEPGGYDHNWVLEQAHVGALTAAAEVYEPESGRVLRIATTEPGVQFYTGNYLDGTITGKGGAEYRKNAGFCLETQHFPDSPNHPHFPSTVLRPGQVFRSTTVHRFAVRK